MTNLAENIRNQIAGLDEHIEELEAQRAETVVGLAEGSATAEDLAVARENLDKARALRDDFVESLGTAEEKDEEARKAAEQALVVAEFRAMPEDYSKMLAAAERFDAATDELIEAARAYLSEVQAVEADPRWCGDPWGVFLTRLTLWEDIRLPEHYSRDHKALAEASARYYATTRYRNGQFLHASGLIEADEVPEEPAHMAKAREEREKREAEQSRPIVRQGARVLDAEGKEVKTDLRFMS